MQKGLATYGILATLLAVSFGLVLINGYYDSVPQYTAVATDLAVTDFSASYIEDSSKAVITVTVKNNARVPLNIPNIGNVWLNVKDDSSQFNQDQSLGGLFNPQGTQEIGPGQTKTFSYIWLNPAVGTYSLTANADSTSAVLEGTETNNVATTTLIVPLRNNPPSVSVSHSPQNPTDQQTVTFNANASDDRIVSKIEIFVDGTLQRTCNTNTSTASCNFTGGPYSSGSHTYNATATDNNGAVSSAQNTFSVSHVNLQPTISVSHSPQNPLSNQNVTFTANASDSDGTITQMQISVDGTLQKTCTSSPCSFNGGPYSAGSHNYSSTATDNDGAQATVNKTFSVGQANAAPSIDATHSPANPNDQQSVTFNATASDSDGIVTTIKIFVDNSLQRTCTDNQTGVTTCSYTGGPYNASNHTYKAEATDNNGTTSSVTRTFTVVHQNAAPSVASSHSPQNPTDTQNVTFKGNATDIDGTITEIKISVDGTLQKTCTSNSSFASCNYTGGPYGAGDHSYIVEGKDNSGDVSSTTKTFSVEHPNVAPTVDVTHSPTNPNSDQQVTFSATASDEAPGHVSIIRIYVDGSNVKTCSGTNQTPEVTNCTFTGGPYSSGSHSYSADAQDNQGLVGSSANKTFNVNSPPTVSASHSPQNPQSTENVTFTVNASDSDGTISETKVFVDGALQKTCAASTCIYTGGPYGAGNHTYEGKATDNSNTTASSGVKSFNVGQSNTAPTVDVSHSPQNPNAQQNVTFTATANDSDGTITQVKIFVDGSNVRTCGSSPCTYTNTYSQGSHYYHAEATDNSNATTTTTNRTFVVNSIPTVNVNHTPQNPNTNQSVTFNADASDADGLVTSISIYVDSQNVTTCNIGSNQSSTCSYTGGPYTQGSHTYYATATDNSGAQGTSTTRSFNVSQAPIPNVPPTVSASHSPQNPQSNQTVAFTVTGNDSDGSVVNVTIKVDGSVVKNCTGGNSSSLTCTHNGGPYNAGNHTYEGIAYDDDGSSGTSGVKIFTVTQAQNGSNQSNNTAPTVTTNSASNVNSTGATLNGAANPNGLSTTGWFRYGTNNPGSCTDSFGTRVPSSGGTDLGSGSSSVSYSRSVAGLSSSTTYYYCAIAENSAGKGFGSIVSFTTSNQSNQTNQTNETRPDLTLSSQDITFSSSNITTGQNVTITATIRNNGNATASNFVVKFDDTIGNSTTTIDTRTVSSLAAGASTNIQVTWTPSQSGNHTITVTADSTGVVTEWNENNNVATKSVNVS